MWSRAQRAEDRGQRVVVGPAAARPGQVCEKIDFSAACARTGGLLDASVQVSGPALASGPVRVRVRVRGPVTVPFVFPGPQCTVLFPLPVPFRTGTGTGMGMGMRTGLGLGVRRCGAEHRGPRTEDSE